MADRAERMAGRPEREGRTDREGRTESEFLEKYRADDYERPSVTADMVIFTVSDKKEDNYRKLPEKELKLLLIRRGAHPFLGQWALPGGFVRPDETTEQAAARELREETGVENVYLEQLYTFSDIGRDPRTRVISCAYMALIDGGRVQVKAGDDADEAVWFKVGYRLLRERKEMIEDGFEKTQQYELKLGADDGALTGKGMPADGGPVAGGALTAIVERTTRATQNRTETSYTIVSHDGFAFDHAKIIAYAIERLRGKVNYTDIALHLMPKLFTLTELQQVYEVILDKELLKAAFRRKVADLVTETDHYTDSAGHRPSRLYRRKLVESE